MTRLKFLFRLVSAAGVAAVDTVFRSGWSTDGASGRILDDPARLPVNDVGLVLGTSKRRGAAFDNPHFTHRMEAAASCFRARAGPASDPERRQRQPGLR